MSKPFAATAVALVMVCAWLVADASQSVQAKDAREILDATGVQGGLVVHVGCGDGKLTAALCANESYVVQGLATRKAHVEEAREHIESLGLCGKVSVDRLRGRRLPYADNLVALVVAKDLGKVSLDEVMRVLRPGGVAYVMKRRKWQKAVKPWPEETDEWTHYLHDADGNAVAHDSVVGPPRRLQWVGSPRWARHHDHMASMSALVSAGGRMFYVFDEGPTSSIQLPPKWALIARDAYNGVILWKRPISSWNTHLWPLKSGPAQLARRLVAVGDRVYVTLGLDAPLSVLDAATGEVIRTYEETETTEEVIASEGTLFVLVHDAPTKWPEYRPKYTYVWDNMGLAHSGWAWDEEKRRIMAVQADTGEVLWEADHRVAPMTLATNGERVFFYDGEKVVCLARGNGEEQWCSEPVARRTRIHPGFGPRLVVYQDVVLFAGGKRSMTAFSAQTGETLWTSKHARSGHNSLEDLFVIDGLAWSGATAAGDDSGVFTGRDVHTGKVKREFAPDVNTHWFHQRCYPSKATDRYLLPSRTGIEFVDFRTQHWTPHHWVRGGCIYGIMPCNGLVYAPPHSCACYIESKLNGFCALAPEPTGPQDARETSDKDRLERGPAYGKTVAGPSAPSREDEWPTYRHDPARSGFTKASVPVELNRLWEADLTGRLSAVVIAEDKVFVASIDTHTVYALEAGSGKTAWRYIVGGRVDSPPTIHQGRVLFGSADGWVYCLRASDGLLIWRFRAAPEDRRLMAFEQVESVWPVHGSVLVQDDIVYCVAGRSMFLDGGLRLLRLDPKTGRKLSETVLDDRDPGSGDNLQVHIKGMSMPVALPDVLSSDGRFVYMRSQPFDLEGARQHIAPKEVTQQAGEGAHLFSPVGFLDDSWFHRAYWLFGRSVAGGWGGWFRAGRFVPSGRLLVFDESSVYGFGRKPEYWCQSSVLEYQLFAADKAINAESIRHVTQATRQMNIRAKKRSAAAVDWKLRQGFPLADRCAVGFKWLHEQPSLQARAMVLADETLFVAGPPDVADEEAAFSQPDDAGIRAQLDEQDAALRGQKGALLWAVSASDGERLAEYVLGSPPVFDGMASAGGRLYMALQDGRLICMGN